jgi:hypothetical protein
MRWKFVNLNCSEIAHSGNILGVSDEDRRRIRIQAMKDFRRKERLQNPTSKLPLYDV